MIGNVPPGPRVSNAGSLRTEHEIEHSAGAEGDLRGPARHAGLADEARLLVADERGDGRRPRQRGRRADHPGRVHHRREHPRGDAQRLDRRGGPARAVGAEQRRDRGVARVDHVERALREVPRDPGVDGAEAEVARSVRIERVEEVLDLGRRGVRCEPESRGAVHEAVDDRPEVLPALRGPDGFTGRPVPDHRRSALVRDPDRRHRSAVGRDCGLGRVLHPCGQRPCVELDEPGRGRVGEELPVLLVVHRRVGTDDRRADRRRPDVADEDFHQSGQTGSGAHGSGSPSLPGFMMPCGSSPALSAASTSKAAPSASRTKRDRLRPTPW